MGRHTENILYLYVPLCQCDRNQACILRGTEENCPRWFTLPAIVVITETKIVHEENIFKNI